MSEKKEFINIEKIALRKIRKYDKTLIQKIYNEEEEDKYRKIIVMTTKSGENDQLQIFLRTKGCSMKRAGSCWNCNYGMMRKCNIKKEEYISEFEKILDKYDEYESVLIGAYGSVTDEIELDQTIFIEILKIALNKSRIKDIVIETHITKISPKLIEEIYILNKRKKILSLMLE